MPVAVDVIRERYVAKRSGEKNQDRGDRKFGAGTTLALPAY
jgi:hypothetical protein